MMRLVGISGSLRNDSYSTAILNTIAELTVPQVVFDFLNIGDFPHYNADLEKDILPKVVTDGKGLIMKSDGVIVVTPEFNHGIPGVLKNTLDWLSRPAFNSCFLNKPVFFITQSTGELAGVRAQYQLRETLASMLCHIIPLKEVAIAHIGQKVVEGRVVDEDTLVYLKRTIEAVIANINKRN